MDVGSSSLPGGSKERRGLGRFGEDWSGKDWVGFAPLVQWENTKMVISKSGFNSRVGLDGEDWNGEDWNGEDWPGPDGLGLERTE